MTDGLTGRKRLREQKRFLRSSLLVLQVEEQMTQVYNEDQHREILFWRDAKVQDLTEDDKKR